MSVEMNSEIKALPVIEVSDLEKAYHIYDSPHDRLKQIFFFLGGSATTTVIFLP